MRADFKERWGICMHPALKLYSKMILKPGFPKLKKNAISNKLNKVYLFFSSNFNELSFILIELDEL